MCPLLVPVFQGFFFAAAINSTIEANKAGSTSVKQSILLRCLWECRIFIVKLNVVTLNVVLLTLDLHLALLILSFFSFFLN